MQKYLIVLLLFISSSSFAKGSGGGWHLGFGAGIVTVDQEDMNTLQQRANSRVGGITTSQLGNAYELTATFGYRFKSSIYEMLFRPSYFFHSQSGTGASQPYEYGVSGYSVFPIFRFYPLESSVMKFFFQVGVGYGGFNGEITEASYNLKFSGGSFGFLGGLGIEMCFVPSHCFALEGNLRGLGASRVVADSVSGTPAGSVPGISQGTSAGQEVEMDSRDLGVSISGLQALLGYVIHW